MKKLFLCGFMIMSLLLTYVVVLPAEVLAAEVSVDYLDENGNLVTGQTATVIDEETSGLDNGWYVVNADVTRGETITVHGDDVHLILADGKTLTVTGNDNAGINVSKWNKNLTIYGQTGGTGVLNATGSGNGGAGIGGGYDGSGGNGDVSCGTVTINGGVLNANGGPYSAGIGGGYVQGPGNSNGGTITINGGKLKATGGQQAPGIGSGKGGDGGKINIKGGTVEATGGSWAAGMGGGYFGWGANVTLSGGVVFAHGGYEARDVGGGTVSSNHGSLNISDRAALFLRNDHSVEPADPVLHTHEYFTDHIGGTDIYGIPVSWDGNFGAWLRLSTITFKDEGDNKLDDITQREGTAITAPDNPTRTGYTFSGWSPEIPSTMPLENIEIVAQWNIKQYTITFDSDGGSDVASITQDYGTAVTTPDNPTRTGYTFNGWNKEIPSTMPSENVEIVAQWTINEYTIMFDSNGGSDVADITQDYDTAIAVPGNPTRTGYTFSGWDPILPGTMPAEDMELVAQWSINQYTIMFDSDGGSEVADITQDYGTAVTTPDNPTRTGYTFSGWNKEIPSTMPAEDIEFVAKWTIIKDVEPIDPVKPALPKTGSVDLSLFYGLGGLLILIGILLGRKKGSYNIKQKN